MWSHGDCHSRGKFRLLDEKGQDITTPNIVGELLYEGRNVTMGYAECCEDLTKGDERGGILSHGRHGKNSIKTDSFILLDEKTLS